MIAGVMGTAEMRHQVDPRVTGLFDSVVTYLDAMQAGPVASFCELATRLLDFDSPFIGIFQDDIDLTPSCEEIVGPVLRKRRIVSLFSSREVQARYPGLGWTSIERRGGSYGAQALIFERSDLSAAIGYHRTVNAACELDMHLKRWGDQFEVAWWIANPSLCLHLGWQKSSLKFPAGTLDARRAGAYCIDGRQRLATKEHNG